MKKVIFHPRFQKDLFSALDYYEIHAGTKTADRFFEAVDSQVQIVSNFPERFHFDTAKLRRCNLPKFPFHILFSITRTEIRVQVLKHDLRHPTFGLRRKF